MHESENSSPMSSPRSIREYHQGNGTLRGGGLQKVFYDGPTFKAYKRKLDYRMGYCILGSLVTIATILTIFGFFHETAHEGLLEYIKSTRQMLIDLLPSTVSPTLAVSAITAASYTPVNTDVIKPKLSSTDSTESNNAPSNDMVLLMTALTNYTTIKSNNELEEDSKEYLNFPHKELNTCYGSNEINEEKCLVVDELNKYHDILQSSHIALWNLAMVNIIIAMMLTPFALIFNFELVKNNCYKLIYRVMLLLTLFFMAVQLIILINPLLYNSFIHPDIVDKLFIEKLPREKKLTDQVESRFACQFDYISQLVELNLQEPCIPRIKNMLLLPYAVILLIMIDLIPFIFAFFTYAWDKWLKDSSLCSNARSRIELNNQRR
ncbi:unnamed protein product [Thelazia callipaeda]|uniref:G_PROTEIN_RECEP_F1_2 domain-containing protein n=1 Tax=Thelazia callipaeda TaxID=103827 RepID=A0A0N5D1Y8_THECL|nr:unnamed protein product [Thelazia callipaeda]